MVEVRARRPVEDALRLALDLCLGLGAFIVSLTGAVQIVVSEAMPPEDAVRRIEHLARSCLSHPSARGTGLFWNAEVSTEAESADQAIACVAVPIWAGDVWRGLLGVVDMWLPEPDEDQRAGLDALTDELAASAFPEVAARAGAGAGPVVDEPDHVAASGAVGEAPPGFAPAAGGAAPPGFAPGAPAGSPRGDPPAPGGVPGLGGEGLLWSVLDHLPDAVVVTRGDGTIVLVNERFTQMAGRGRELLVGSDVRSVVSDRPGLTPGGPGPGSGPGTHRSARRLIVLGPSGEELPVTALDVRLAGGAAAGGPGGGGRRDWFVTVLRPAPSADGYAATTTIDCGDLVGNLDDGVLCLDGTGTVVLANRAADRLHGLAPGRTLVGRPLPDVSGLRTEEGHPLTLDEHPGILVVRDGTARSVHLVLGGEEDRQQHVTVTARPFPVDGYRGALVVLHDSTDQWLEQRRLTQFALYDPLTGLANRYLLLEELRRMLLLLARQGGAVALVYLDLDGFKHVNDEYGHDMGDEVLAAVARRLRGAVRSDDVVARLGGDEFVIAHASTAEHLPDGDLVVSRLRKVLSAPFRVRSQAFDVGASIGWVSTDRGEEGPDALLAKADRAMYLQKRNRAAGRGAPA